ncbi:MAG: amidohydrolase family protein [Spirochaetota bacterium]
MKRFLQNATLALTIGVTPAWTQSPPPGIVAIRGARILTVTQGEIPNGVLVMKNGKILSVGSAGEVSIPSDAQVIDGTGSTLTPGLVDAHSHLGLGASEGVTEDNESSDPVVPHLRIIDSIHPEGTAPDRNQFGRAVAGGVTTAIIRPGSRNLIGGQAAVLKLRGRTVDEMVVRFPADMKMALGKKLYFANKGQAPTTKMGGAFLVRQALTEGVELRQALDRYAKERTSKPDAEPPARNLKAEAMLKVVDGDIPVHIHLYTVDEIMTAIRLAEEFHFKGLSFAHANETWKVADLLAAKHIAVVVGPEMIVYDEENRPINLAQALTSKGVEVSITTDADVVQQEFLRFQASIAIKYGMDPAEALKALTLHPARLAGMESRIGSLEPGKDADLVMFDGDPFDLQTRVMRVFIDGNQVQ